MDKRPDFYGFWVQPSGMNSVFFMTILSRNKSEVIGTIEDILGTAEFKGKLTADEISFTKKYVKASSEASDKPVEYFGRRRNRLRRKNHFEGTYSSGTEVGSFVLQENLPSHPLDTVLYHIRQSNSRYE